MPNLRRLFSSLGPTDRWPAHIDRIANGRLPADGRPGFPWEELQTCTNEYLQARKPSQLEQDALLASWMRNHNNRAVAFAACAHLLPPEALRSSLSIFKGLSALPDHSDIYYHAFVVAQRYGDGMYSASDVEWAVVAAGLVSSPLGLWTSRLEAILTKVQSSGLPNEPELQASVKMLLHTTLIDCLAAKGYQGQKLWPSNLDMVMMLQAELWRFSFWEYHNWTLCLQQTYGHSGPALDHAVAWVKDRLAPYADILENLESIPNASSAVRSIYTCSKEPMKTHIRTMLVAVRTTSDAGKVEIILRIISEIVDGGKKAVQTAFQATMQLSQCSVEDFRLCQQLVMLIDLESLQVAATRQAMIVRRPGTAKETAETLRWLAEALHFPPEVHFEEGIAYFLRQFGELQCEARRLIDLYSKLMAIDKNAATAVMSLLDIQLPSNPLDTEINDLPVEIQEHIERVNDDLVELHFSISRLNALQQAALGLRTNSNVVVRLRMDCEVGWSSFCVHTFDLSEARRTKYHHPCKLRGRGVRKLLPEQYCGHERSDYVSNLISHRLLDHLWAGKENKNSTLHTIYRTTNETLSSITSTCPMCGRALGAKMYRPTSCWREECRLTRMFHFQRLPTETNVVNLLTAGVLAAASTLTTIKPSRSIDDMMELLLPDFPGDLGDARRHLGLVNNIPTSRAPAPERNSLQMREMLRNYASTMLGGFLMEAQGHWRIHQMPGASQYVVVDNPVGVTEAFAKHDLIQPRKVLFHGTHLSRLPAILTHGLKVLSNTDLMTSGAALGPGIYLAEEPSTSMGYARATELSGSVGQDLANYVDKGVLLGVEYAGDDIGRGNGVHVATDETKLLLRYVFLVSPDFHAPQAGHVNSAMLSNYHILRNGLR